MSGNHEIHFIDVLGEPVDDPADGGRVEEGHRWGQDVLQHLLVQLQIMASEWNPIQQT